MYISAETHVRENPALLTYAASVSIKFCLKTDTFDLLTPKYIDFRDSSWHIST